MSEKQKQLVEDILTASEKLPPEKPVPAARRGAGPGHGARAPGEGGEVMDQKQVKEILGKQLQLLAEVSKKTSKPEDLPMDVTKAMVLLAQNL